MDQEAILSAVKLLFAVVAIGVLVAYVLVPMVRAWSQPPDPGAVMPDYSRYLEEEDEELQVPTPEEGKAQPSRHELIGSARSDPRSTAMMVQRWLKEKG